MARVVALLVALAVSARGDGYVAISKRPHPALDRAAAKRVFNGREKAWDDGEAIVLVIGSEDSPAMHWLAQTLYGVSAKTFLTKLKQDTFRGEIRHPLSADDDAKTIARVRSGPGVVGVITEAAAKRLPADLAVLRVQW